MPREMVAAPRALPQHPQWGCAPRGTWGPGPSTATCAGLLWAAGTGLFPACLEHLSMSL